MDPLQPRDVITTERTAKRFKAIMLVGILGLCLSPAPAIVAFVYADSTRFAMNMLSAAGIIALASFAVYAVGNGLAWWYHG